MPNTLIGLETGVIPDASFTLPWDGEEREIASWNRDHDLRSAISESAPRSQGARSEDAGSI